MCAIAILQVCEKGIHWARALSDCVLSVNVSKECPFGDEGSPPPDTADTVSACGM